MITTINKFKNYLNESKMNKYYVINNFTKNNYDIVLNGSSKFLNIVEFNINDVVSYTVQNGSLGTIINITNHTTNNTAKYWTFDYGLDDKTKNSLKLIDENINLNQSYTEPNDISNLFTDYTSRVLYEIFSDYIMGEIDDISNGGYEILLDGNNLIFNAFDTEEKEKNSKIVWTTTIDITGIEENTDILFNKIESKLKTFFYN